MHRLYYVGIFLIIAASFIVFVVYKPQFLGYMNQQTASELAQLRIENESLKKLTRMSVDPEITVIRGIRYQTTRVYSSYPYNDQKVIFIDSGSEQGIKSGMPVAIAPGIAFGYVTDVFPRYSAVRTIFDADFETTVRVGTAEEKALLEGGQNPIVSLIRDKKIVTGDAIVTAGLQFPYGMEVGKIGTLLESQDTFFRKAEIQLSYNLRNIRKIYVILNHFSEL